MKILLYIPPSGRYMREVRCQAPLSKVIIDCNRTPLSLSCIAAILGDRHTCKIVDYPAQGMGWDEFRKDINNFSPDMIVANLTIFTCDKDLESYKVAKSINNNITTVAFGGDYSNVALMMKEGAPLDIFICQEPEEAFMGIAGGTSFNKIRGIIYKEKGNVIDNSDTVYIDDLNNLPYPRRDLLNNGLYIRPDTRKMQTEIEVSRGCTRQCIFCMAPLAHGRKIRTRSSASIIGEIEECINRFNIRNFFFRADTFTWDKDWVKELCCQIASKRLPIQWCCNSRVDTIDADMIHWMKRAGCWLISFGIESGNQDILDKVKKGFTLEKCRMAVELCRESGIRTYLNFMLGLPWEDKNTVMRTLDFAKELDGDLVEFPLAIPFPGTGLYNFAVEKGLISKEGLMTRQIPIPTLYLSSGQVFTLWRKVVLSYYCRPGYVYRILRKAAREKVLFNYFRFGVKKIIDIHGQRYQKISQEHI